MRLLSCIRARRATLRQDDRGTMSMVMLIAIIGLGLAALMTPLVVTQSQSTSRDDTRVQSLHQAESGIDAMLGRLRSATPDTSLAKQLAKLPCLPLTWQTSSAAAGYSVKVMKYYVSDPQVTLDCANGFTDGTGPVAPRFALIESTGWDGTGNRKSTRVLDTTYAFNTVDVIAFDSANGSATGGQIRLNPAGFFDVDETECLAATGSVPEVGMPLSVQACSADASNPAQMFFYNKDLSLRLVQTVTATSAGLCVTAPATGNAVTLEPCLGGDTASSNQQWSLDEFSAFHDAGSLNTCLAVRATGTDIVTKSCVQPRAYDSTASWLPTPSVRAGAAGAGSNELLNFAQFGQCAQVTVTNAVSLATCDQKVNSSDVRASQQFTYDATTTHWQNGGGKCLTSHGSASPPVTVESCGSSPSQNWVDYGAAAADQEDASQWSVSARYTIVDSTGLCLSVSPTSGSDGTSTLRTDMCDGTARQKWNSGGQSQDATVKDTTEK